MYVHRSNALRRREVELVSGLLRANAPALPGGFVVHRTTLKRFAAVAALGVAVVLWAADAEAQRRRSGHRTRSVVFVSAGVYRPYYGGAFWQRYPYPYPYPYPYAYRWDDRSDLRIQATPREAQVYVDGYFVGIVDQFDGFAQRLRVEPGEHDIELYLDGYRTRRDRMLLRPGESYQLRHAMEPLPPGAPPEPRPTPAASAPASARPSNPAAERRRRPNDPRGTQDEASLGAVSIRVQPAGATVWIDGERWEWPEGEDRLVVDIPEGSHRVEIQREGHRPYSTIVVVRRGETSSLNVSLPRQ